MGYKLGSNSGRAIFIKDDKYYDVNTISNGDISSNSLKALSDTEKLSQLYINLNDYEPSGNLSDINLDPPIIPTNVFLESSSETDLISRFVRFKSKSNLSRAPPLN